MICYYYEAPHYFFFAPDLPGMLYYSHIPVTFLALVVGFFVFLNRPKALLNRLLLMIALSFALLTLNNLITWTNIDSRIILFSWSLFGTLQALISVLSIYFIYVFIYEKDATFIIKIIFSILLLPVLLLGSTNINLSGFDLAWCGSFAYEGEAYNLYYTLLGLVAMIWIAFILTDGYRKAVQNKRRQIILMGLGIELFLFLFFTIFYLADYLTTVNSFADSRLELYGFFGMGIFMTTIGVLIVRFKTFNVGTHAVNALVVALLILVASQFTYVDTTLTTILTGVTLLLTTVAGLIIIRSVKNEIRQREEIEKLAQNLASANKKLKQLDKLKSEFVSIASHQLRSPLTSIRGYASMLIEGSFGNIPQGAIEPLTRIEASAKNMAMSVEDYLNVSRIESGNMKYELSDFNLKDEAEKIADDIRPQAMKKGLLLTFKSDLNSKAVVHADIGKTVQILHNLINNAMKYTPKGSITVFVHDDMQKKLIHVEIIDTGVGLDPKDLEHLFEKFKRAEGANEVNTSGTGLGLFVAQKMAQGMGGDVIAHSEGKGKGSHFILTLPLAM